MPNPKRKKRSKRHGAAGRGESRTSVRSSETIDDDGGYQDSENPEEESPEFTGQDAVRNNEEQQVVGGQEDNEAFKADEYRAETEETCTSDDYYDDWRRTEIPIPERMLPGQFQAALRGPPFPQVTYTTEELNDIETQRRLRDDRNLAEMSIVDATTVAANNPDRFRGLVFQPYLTDTDFERSTADCTQSTVPRPPESMVKFNFNDPVGLTFPPIRTDDPRFMLDSLASSETSTNRSTAALTNPSTSIAKSPSRRSSWSTLPNRFPSRATSNITQLLETQSAVSGTQAITNVLTDAENGESGDQVGLHQRTNWETTGDGNKQVDGQEQGEKEEKSTKRTFRRCSFCLDGPRSRIPVPKRMCASQRRALLLNTCNPPPSLVEQRNRALQRSGGDGTKTEEKCTNLEVPSTRGENKRRSRIPVLTRRHPGQTTNPSTTPARGATSTNRPSASLQSKGRKSRIPVPIRRRQDVLQNPTSQEPASATSTNRPSTRLPGNTMRNRNPVPRRMGPGQRRSFRSANPQETTARRATSTNRSSFRLSQQQTDIRRSRIPVHTRMGQGQRRSRLGGRATYNLTASARRATAVTRPSIRLSQQQVHRRRSRIPLPTRMGRGRRQNVLQNPTSQHAPTANRAALTSRPSLRLQMGRRSRIPLITRRDPGQRQDHLGETALPMSLPASTEINQTQTGNASGDGNNETTQEERKRVSFRSNGNVKKRCAKFKYRCSPCQLRMRTRIPIPTRMEAGELMSFLFNTSTPALLAAVIASRQARTGNAASNGSQQEARRQVNEADNNSSGDGVMAESCTTPSTGREDSRPTRIPFPTRMDAGQLKDFLRLTSTPPSRSSSRSSQFTQSMIDEMLALRSARLGTPLPLSARSENRSSPSVPVDIRKDESSDEGHQRKTPIAAGDENNEVMPQQSKTDSHRPEGDGEKQETSLTTPRVHSPGWENMRRTRLTVPTKMDPVQLKTSIRESRQPSPRSASSSMSTNNSASRSMSLSEIPSTEMSENQPDIAETQASADVMAGPEKGESSEGGHQKETCETAGDGNNQGVEEQVKEPDNKSSGDEMVAESCENSRTTRAPFPTRMDAGQRNDVLQIPSNPLTIVTQASIAIPADTEEDESSDEEHLRKTCTPRGDENNEKTPEQRKAGSQRPEDDEGKQETSSSNFRVEIAGWENMRKTRLVIPTKMDPGQLKSERIRENRNPSAMSASSSMSTSNSSRASSVTDSYSTLTSVSQTSVHRSRTVTLVTADAEEGEGRDGGRRRRNRKAAGDENKEGAGSDMKMVTYNSSGDGTNNETSCRLPTPHSASCVNRRRTRLTVPTKLDPVQMNDLVNKAHTSPVMAESRAPSTNQSASRKPSPESSVTRTDSTVRSVSRISSTTSEMSVRQDDNHVTSVKRNDSTMVSVNRRSTTMTSVGQTTGTATSISRSSSSCQSYSRSSSTTTLGSRSSSTVPSLPHIGRTQSKHGDRKKSTDTIGCTIDLNLGSESTTEIDPFEMRVKLKNSKSHSYHARVQVDISRYSTKTPEASTSDARTPISDVRRPPINGKLPAINAKESSDNGKRTTTKGKRSNFKGKCPADDGKLPAINGEGSSGNIRSTESFHNSKGSTIKRKCSDTNDRKISNGKLPAINEKKSSDTINSEVSSDNGKGSITKKKRPRSHGTGPNKNDKRKHGDGERSAGSDIKKSSENGERSTTNRGGAMANDEESTDTENEFDKNDNAKGSATNAKGPVKNANAAAKKAEDAPSRRSFIPVPCRSRTPIIPQDNAAAKATRKESAGAVIDGEVAKAIEAAGAKRAGLGRAWPISVEPRVRLTAPLRKPSNTWDVGHFGANAPRMHLHF